MAKTYWTHRPSRYAFATDRGWEMVYKGKNIVIRPHANLLTKLTEAGYDEFGSNRFGAETAKIENVAPEQVQDDVSGAETEANVVDGKMEQGLFSTEPETTDGADPETKEETTEAAVETKEKSKGKNKKAAGTSVNVGIGIDTTDATE